MSPVSGRVAQGRHQYEDFELKITSHGDEHFAQVIHSPAGENEKEQRLSLPFDERTLLKLENAILRGGHRFRGPVSVQERVLRDFGRSLFRSVFLEPTMIRDLYVGSRNRVEEMGLGLRIKLRIEGTELGVMPWEYLYDERVTEDYVSLHYKTPVVRYLHMRRGQTELAVEGPLRVLGMIADPGRHDPLGSWEPLDTIQERDRIDKAITSLQREELVHFEWVHGETPQHLLDKNLKGPWHVFHFIGHGGVHKAQGNGEEHEEGYVVLVNEEGRPTEIPAPKLMRLVEGDGSLRLAVLNCCESGSGGGSPAASLVRAGIPAVIAMQFPISDEAAIELASGFYAALASKYPVDAALTEARKRMNIQSDVEWGIPVLYMRSPDGRIFRSPAPAERRPSPAAPTGFDAGATPTGLPTPQAGDTPVTGVVTPPREPEPGLPGPPRGAQPPTPSTPTSVASFDELEEVDQLLKDFAASGALDQLPPRELDSLIRLGERCLEAKPEDAAVRARLAKAHFHRALAYSRDKSIDKAFVNLSTAIDLDDGSWECFYHRANIYARGGQFDSACEDIEAAITLEPQRAELYWSKGVACMLAAGAAPRDERLAAAVDAFSEAIRLDPGVSKYHASRGAAHTQMEQHEHALSDLDKALELAPNDAKTYYHRGLVKEILGDSEGAREDLRTSSERGFALATAKLGQLG